MDRLFLDANILFSAAYRPKAGLQRLWKLTDVTLLSSHYALEEARFNLDESSQKKRLALLASNLHFVEHGVRKLPANVVLPEKDRPILLAAIEGRATHLPTGDLRHFGPYLGKIIEGVLISTPATYLSGATKR